MSLNDVKNMSYIFTFHPGAGRWRSGRGCWESLVVASEWFFIGPFEQGEEWAWRYHLSESETRSRRWRGRCGWGVCWQGIWNINYVAVQILRAPWICTDVHGFWFLVGSGNSLKLRFKSNLSHFFWENFFSCSCSCSCFMNKSRLLYGLAQICTYLHWFAGG